MPPLTCRHYSSQLSHEKRSKISILPSHALNTVLPAFTTLNHDHLILHLAAEDNAFRVQVLRKAADGIIRCIRGEGCQPQWGLSREVLLNIATNHYENMFRTLKYDRLLLAPNSLSDNVIAQWLAELRMSTGKLAHIIQHHNQTEDELLVRLDGFESAKSVGLNLFQCAIPSFSSKCASSGPWPGCSAEDALQLLSRHSLQHDNSCRRTLPEACKTVAELGFELAVEFSKRTMASISNPGLSQILMDVDGALALLQGLVDHKQQSLVNGMVVEFHSFLSTAHYISITNF